MTAPVFADVETGFIKLNEIYADPIHTFDQVKTPKDLQKMMALLDVL